MLKIKILYSHNVVLESWTRFRQNAVLTYWLLVLNVVYYFFYFFKLSFSLAILVAAPPPQQQFCATQPRVSVV